MTLFLGCQSAAVGPVSPSAPDSTTADLIARITARKVEGAPSIKYTVSLANRAYVVGRPPKLFYFPKADAEQVWFTVNPVVGNMEACTGVTCLFKVNAEQAVQCILPIEADNSVSLTCFYGKYDERSGFVQQPLRNGETVSVEFMNDAPQPGQSRKTSVYVETHSPERSKLNNTESITIVVQ
jgi:hypothetical protein